MITLQTKYKWDMSRFFMHACAFLLLLEWLRPLIGITNVGRLDIFVIFIGICFTLSFFQTRWQIPIKIVTILFIIHFLYYKNAFINPSWLTKFFADISRNSSLFFQGDLLDISPVFPTLLFFLSFWFLSSFSSFWVIHKKRGLLFLALTIIYITTFHNLHLYNANYAIIRTVVIGFFILSLLQIERIKKMEHLQNYARAISKLLRPLTIFIVLSATIAYFAPKFGPQWPNPMDFLKFNTSEASKEQAVSKIGYGLDDSQLGGPFKPDNTIIFTAQTQNKQYWRVETKDFYTGKGWDVSENRKKVSFKNKNDVVSWYEPNTKTEITEATITMQKSYPHLTYPAGLVSVEASSDVSYSVDPFSEKIYTMHGDSSTTLNSYKVTYEVPEFSIENLKSVKTNEGHETSPYFMAKYTQLPESLPQRVKDLAVNLTNDKDNRYDKVLAIENYFTDNSFVYETMNVLYPAKNQDYVDQFLFDTKSGYCNNFSTSMIVLLRSAGIPARWVKGFTEGTLENTLASAEGENVYTIANNNAHSWVEVYFPGYGWIPFEPTKGFTNPYNFTNNTPASTSQNNEVNNSNNEPIHQRNNEAKLKSLIENTEEASTKKITNSKNDFSWWYVFLSTIPISIIGYILFTTRMKWITFFIILFYKYRKDDAVYQKAYGALLKQFARIGIPRGESQTFREYALHIDTLYNSADMQQLTFSYENAMYQKEQAAAAWKTSVHLWEVLMKKAASLPKSNDYERVI
ncbi:transglutaminase TgpA family protein [Bacillus mycoides]|uniref:Transglutaminase domain-containing protein n=1 Tax=Bacillus mycoides TaxID=1405 RepID=A0ABX6ZE71_BACMY|nr:transglutaminaseTgpA domain-containing protein [Bacillus mycoides]AJH21631.1 transglutaminase-like superfamily protein [Bacillus mycoides]MDR4237540.1 transglutaminase domain-containing protein [Bacillus mycoides]MED1428638.1 transglutaminaseTgpA domain-containing protein [Bacillus mycoides]MED1486837.1 transglutaminaseTgpA domain-containing protein [Bacillus mycoides]QQA17917.1 transglutaminase domain-containing protein [Bacillus mycoides]